MVKGLSLLEAAREYERKHGEAIADRPLCHLTPYVGWMNDPNGLCFYGGQYHLFYQYHPYDCVWGPMHWGHAVSRDMLRWEHLPAALAPDTAADTQGCFSGSAVQTDDGRLALYYTGVYRNEKGEERQAQCAAFGDGLNFHKAAGNPLISAAHLPVGCSHVDFRDPKVWRAEDGRYYMVTGSRTDTRDGAILLFVSENGLDWRYAAELDASCGKYGKMWECPDFFELDGMQVLITSPQEMQATADGEFHPGHGTLALLGRYDKKTHAFERMSAQAVDQGLDFYAPQTMFTPDGRRVMVGWMENWGSCQSSPRNHAWFGRMSLPRELFVKNGRLWQRPVREIESLWQDTVCLSGQRIAGERRFDGIRGRTFDMTLRIAAGEKLRGFAVRFAQDERFFTEIRFDAAAQEIVFDRTCSGTRRDIAHVRSVTACVRDGAMQLRLIVDGESAELFVGEGERVLSCLIETPLEARGISFFAQGEAIVDICMHMLEN